MSRYPSLLLLMYEVPFDTWRADLMVYQPTVGAFVKSEQVERPSRDILLKRIDEKYPGVKVLELVEPVE